MFPKATFQFFGSLRGTVRLSKLILSPSEKEFTLKEKNLLPLGANSFLSELTPFQNESWCVEKQTGS